MHTPQQPARPFLYTNFGGFCALFIIFGASTILSRELEVGEYLAPPVPTLKIAPSIEHANTTPAGFDDLVGLLQAQFSPIFQACTKSTEGRASSHRGRSLATSTDKFHCLLTAALNHFRSRVLGQRSGRSPSE
jgi:hypothetical protein